MMSAASRLLRAATLAASALLPALPGFAAEPFPTRPVKLIVPYAPGGGPDLLTRGFAESLSLHLGQNVVVENKVGAGGMLAGQVAAASPANGYTLLLGASTHVTQKLIQPSVAFDPLESFDHVIRLGISASLLVVDAKSPYADARALVAAAKAAPGKFNYASGGVGSAAHLAGAAFAVVTGTEIVHVPYRGSVDIVPAIVNGSTHFGFPIASTALPQIEVGQVRALATTSAKRLPLLPNVPTLEEIFASSDLVIESWSGLWVPAKTPTDIIDILHRAATKAAAEPAVIQLFDRVGAPIEATKSPAEFRDFVRSETEKFRKIVAASNIKVE